MHRTRSRNETVLEIDQGMENAAEFLSVREYEKFSLNMDRAQAVTYRAGWNRAVDTALHWVRNPDAGEKGQ